MHFTNAPSDSRFHRVFLTERGLVRDGIGRMTRRRVPEYAGYDRLIQRAADAEGMIFPDFLNEGD